MAFLQAVLLLLVVSCFPIIVFSTSAQQDCDFCQGNKNCSAVNQNVTNCYTSCQYDNVTMTELCNATFPQNATHTPNESISSNTTLESNSTIEIDDKCKDDPSTFNCLEVLQKSPKYCAIPKIHHMCCQSCQRIISGFPVQSKCKTKVSSRKCPEILEGKPQLCNDNTIRLMCCHMCESILVGFEGSVDQANVTESIMTRDPNSTIVCQDDRNNTKCQAITIYPHRCSDPELQQKCCKSCKTVKSPEKDVCEDHPTATNCPKVLSRSPGYCAYRATREKCCKSCENAISSLPALDLNGKCPIKPDSTNCLKLLRRKPQLCKDIDIAEGCCRTCEGIATGFKARRIHKSENSAQLLNDNSTMPECPEKDASNCLNELSQSPKSCANHFTQGVCCQTCKRLVSSFHVLNLTDKCQNVSDAFNCPQYIMRFPYTCSSTEVHNKCCNMCESLTVGFEATMNMTDALAAWQINNTTLVIDMRGKCYGKKESTNCVKLIRSNPHYCSNAEVYKSCCRTCETILEVTRDIARLKKLLQDNGTFTALPPDLCYDKSDSSHCQELISVSATHCENPDIQRTCCETCEKFISGIPGSISNTTISEQNMMLADSEDISNSTLQNDDANGTIPKFMVENNVTAADIHTNGTTQAQQNNVSITDIVQSIRTTLAYSIATTTASTVHDKETTREMTCQDEPNVFCHILWIFPNYCSSPAAQQRCCGTCKNVTLNGRKTCEDDKNHSDVCQHMAPYPKYCLADVLHETCCLTCENIISSFPEIDSTAECPNQKYEDSDCSILLKRYPHYCDYDIVHSTCCHTCVQNEAGFEAFSVESAEAATNVLSIFD